MSHSAMRPDFSGRWKFNSERSKLEIPQPTRSQFEIEHCDPRFRLTRTLVFGERSDTVTLELTTDGREYVQDFGKVRATMRLAWDGPDLFLDSEVITPDDQGTNRVRYVLQDGGQTFVAVEVWRSTKHRHDNRWVFDRE